MSRRRIWAGLVAVLAACLGASSACRTALLGRTCDDTDAGADSLAATTDGHTPEPVGADLAADLLRERAPDRIARIVPAKLPEICTPDGWCGADLVFSALWGTGVDDLWVVARGLGSYATASVLLHYDGNDWAESSPVTKVDGIAQGADLEALWGAGVNDAWAGGENGALLHWNGKTWSEASPFGNYTIRGLGGTASDDVWAVADEGIIGHWNGSVWRTLSTSPRLQLRGVWASDVDDAWAVGRGGLVLHWDGKQWSPHADAYGGSPTRADLYAVWGSRADDVWAVGAAGVVLHFDGKEWAMASRVPPTTEHLHSVWGDGRGEVWAAGAGGALVHWTGTAWYTVAVDTTEDLLALWGSPAGDLWAMGERAAALHWDGAEWAATPARPIKEHLLAVDARQPDEVWAAGVHGIVARWDGKTWRQQTFGDVTLRAIWSPPEGDVWIVGSGGTILRCWRSFGCERQVDDDATDFTAIWGSAYDDIWIAGTGGTLRHLTKAVWETVPVPTQADLRSIWGMASNDIWIATSGDLVLHWDGKQWSSTSVTSGSNGSTSWQMIFGTAADDIWMIGTSTWSAYKTGGSEPTASRWNGQAWSITSAPSYVSACTVVPRATAQELWVVSPGRWGFGNPDTDERANHTGAARWDGRDWQGSQTGSRNPLYGISASGPDDLWAVGARGSVLRRPGRGS